MYKIPRHKVVIMTKCYRIMVDTDNEPNNCPVAMLEKQALRSKDYVNSWGLYYLAFCLHSPSSLAFFPPFL